MPLYDLHLKYSTILTQTRARRILLVGSS